MVYRQLAKSPLCIDRQLNLHCVSIISGIPTMKRQSAEFPPCIDSQRNPRHVSTVGGIPTVYRQSAKSPPCIDSQRNPRGIAVIGRLLGPVLYHDRHLPARDGAGGIRRRQRRPDCLTSALPPTDMSTYNSKAGQAVRTCPVLYYRGICLMNCHHPDGSFSLRYEANRGQLSVSGITG